MNSTSSIAWVLLMAAVVAPSAFSQGADPLVSGPKLGFVYDRSSQVLKPLLGNTGAAIRCGARRTGIASRRRGTTGGELGAVIPPARTVTAAEVDNYSVRYG